MLIGIPRSALGAAALALALAACKGQGDAPKPAPEPAAAPQKTEALAPAEAPAPVAEPAAPAENPAAAAPSGRAEAPADPQAAAPGGAAAPTAGAQGAAPKEAVAPASPKAGGAVPLPKAPGGILPPGEADRILKVGARPVVKLIEPGKAPQADLSYAFTKGRQAMGVRLDMSMGLSVGGKAIPASPVPQMVMIMDLGVGDREAGDWKVDGSVQSISVAPKGAAQEQIASALKPQVDSLKGLSMSHFVSPKGHVHGLTMKMPPGLPPGAEQMMSGMSQSFESAVAPLPAEPVGPGARWQVVTRVQNAGVDILQFATYTLKSREGAKITLEMSIDQLASGGSIKAPGMPPGVTANLRAFKSGGGGTTQVDLGSVAPEKGRLDVKTSLDIDVSAGPGGAAEKSHVDMTMAAEMFRPAQ